MNSKDEAPKHKIPTGQLLFKTTTKVRTQGRRYERRVLGISARNQRRRRSERLFPPFLATRRGLRRYLSTLRRSDLQVVNPGDRWAQIPRPLLHGAVGVRRGVCDQAPNRRQRRWLERWWAAEAAEA